MIWGEPVSTGSAGARARCEREARNGYRRRLIFWELSVLRTERGEVARAPGMNLLVSLNSFSQSHADARIKVAKPSNQSREFYQNQKPRKGMQSLKLRPHKRSTHFPSLHQARYIPRFTRPSYESLSVNDGK